MGSTPSRSPTFGKLGLQAEVFYRESPEWLKSQLLAGRPVMVWATSGLTIRPVATWTAADGREGRAGGAYLPRGGL